MQLIPSFILPTHTRGDSWLGIPTIGPLGVDDGGDGYQVPMGTPITAAALHFFRVGATVPAITFETGGTGDAPLVIQDAANWELSVPPVNPEDFTLPAGNYVALLKITDGDGITLSYQRYHLPISDENRNP